MHEVVFSRGHGRSFPAPHPRSHGGTPPDLPARPGRVGGGQDGDGLLRATGRAGRRQRRQGPQGPVLSRLLRHPGRGLRRRIPPLSRSAASSDSPRTGRWPSSASATSATPSPTTGASVHGASGWWRCSTPTPRNVGEPVGGSAGRPIDDLAAVAAGGGIAIGIIATPAAVAQDVADRLVMAGTHRSSTSPPP